MKLPAVILVAVVLLSRGAPALADGRLYTEYATPTDPSHWPVRQRVMASGVVEQVTSLINDTLQLRHPVGILFGGEAGPLYDDEARRIVIPYAFLEEVRGRFERSHYAETGVTAEDATMDALMHTLFHEIGHALVPMFDLPMLGREEDAADSLATILLIEYFDGGGEIALSAADLFALESDEVDELVEEDFWDEHGLDLQRFYTTLCMVYGSNPQAYAYLARQANLSAERAALCVDDYHKVSVSWLSLLNEHRKDGDRRYRADAPKG
ncbi:hypothetical protein FCL40_11655 [Ferrimonas sediminicola]|uniref:Metallopeptidase n=1 Tax=Ferrimonas sediminicola TaxID=2569538 RepID=A0A4U1BDI6_9GAMM|nr:DUF4344 domain-containing metallopeptidase [Ferrimonas sediminicola]TKB48369.1 hypothetical protein FCL40_11655 [Ferrimonas sediminicola]